MAANVGGVDKAIRMILGIALLAAAFFQVATGTWALAAYVVGGVALVTGVFGFCPAWAIFGVNTCSAKHAQTTK
jgi:Inner membrane protein YgaP-like, transmembrane domain